MGSWFPIFVTAKSPSCRRAVLGSCILKLHTMISLLFDIVGPWTTSVFAAFSPTSRRTAASCSTTALGALVFTSLFR
ncbi:hypothetical protein KC19_VG243500 [Ceratodon purpureus]|uniref:Uncharacterized protein n=1 Tax=Ceratodon purpureus TaxID=3225 RepID=A0A8T0HUJ6_CERPU|nr:hypothetical protein KC19_VG243500 [Ceratodon purpureus]